MILESAINQLMRNVVDSVLNSSGFSISAKQNSPRPTGSYASVDFVNEVRIGWEQKTLEDSDEDLLQKISGMREILMSISFYRSNAIDNARKVRTGLIRESIQSSFSAANLGLVRTSDVRDISLTRDSKWEEVAQFDVALSAVGTDEDLVRSITSLNISGEYQYRGLIHNFEIEVQ